ncbi:hypothetical protein [Lentzea sp. HUAS12]|uniref:hypothetical protein n=1 Tax=Lentzea sp. HUAS12 TaxID=2951806 RepID=UPI00209EEB44|nr:hypothetical protein [Lentzea sp. HUAS12]USX53372.1 hypothetical protein ND450_04535 [Lentzea sp. HUAS12]
MPRIEPFPVRVPEQDLTDLRLRLAEANQEIAAWFHADGLGRDELRSGLAAGLARWKIDGRWLREAFITPDPGPEVMHVRARLVDEGCTMFSERIQRDARAGKTVGGPPDLIAKMVVHLRNVTFADAYANPGSYDDDELLDTLTDAVLRLLYGANPDDVVR